MEKIGNIIQQIRGVSYTPDDLHNSLSKNSVILFRANNIRDGEINYDDVVYVDRKKVAKEQYLKKGDIIICASSGSKELVGKAAYIKDDLDVTFGAFCKVVRPNDLEQAEYISLFFQSPTYRRKISDSSTGVNINNIRNEHIDNLEIVIPPVTEQKNITCLLNQVVSLISLRKTQLQKLDDLVKARFVEMFGDPIANPKKWPQKRFDEICENLDYRRRPITASDREAGPYPYYGASGIVDYVADYIFDEDILLVSEDGANLLMRTTPIAFSVSGKVWVNNHAHVVRFSQISLQKYIETAFSLIDISDSITGSAQPKLNQAKLNDMVFAIPGARFLEEYLTFVSQIDKSKLSIQQGLGKLETLKKSLMQQYFG